jgi:hypothetical protein
MLFPITKIQIFESNSQLASSGEDSLSSFIYFNFSSTMPKYNEKSSKAKHSTLTLPSFHETEIQLQQATSLPEISNINSQGLTATKQHMYWTKSGKLFIISMYNRRISA